MALGERETDRERESDSVREQGVKRERPENVAPYLDYRKEKQHERKEEEVREESRMKEGGLKGAAGLEH